MAAGWLQKILRHTLDRRGIKADEINGGEHHAGRKAKQYLLQNAG